MCFLHAFLIALIKKYVLVTCLNDTCYFYVCCMKFPTNWFAGNFLLYFLTLLISNQTISFLIFMFGILFKVRVLMNIYMFQHMKKC
jgi:hypothetical protein